MSFRQPRRNGPAPAAAAAGANAPSTTVVADVTPTYTIRGNVRCAETINDRIAWTAEADGAIKIRALPKGTELKTLSGRPRTHCSALLFMESQQQVWAGFGDGHVRIYSALQSEVELEFPATETPGAAVTALLEVEGMVFVAAEDGSLTQWDCQTARRTRTLPGHLSAIRCLGCYMGPTGSIVFSGSDDGTAKAWDPYDPTSLSGVETASDSTGRHNANSVNEDGPCMFTFKGHTKGAVRAIEVVSHANQLWTAGEDATVRVWNLENLQCAAVLRGHGAPVTSLLCIESRMWSGDSAGRVMLWDINSCTPLQDVSGKLTEAAKGGILSMKKMQPSTSWRVWTATASGVVQCWNAETVPILFHNKQKPSGKKGGRKASAASTEDDDVQAWRQFQKTIMDEGNLNNNKSTVEANADGRRPSLGIVDIQRLADEMGYERGRMEVQRELQTQQLLEEENAQLKKRIQTLLRQQPAQDGPQQYPQGAAAAVVPPASQAREAPSASTSAALPADVDPRDIDTSRLLRILPGDDWGYVLSEKPHELRETTRNEVSTALGIPATQITRLDFSKGSLVMDLDVTHPKSVSTSEMDARLQSYAFPQLQGLHANARRQPKTGLDAAEDTIGDLERQLQAAQPPAAASLSRASPEPRQPSKEALQRELDRARADLDAARRASPAATADGDEMRRLQEELEAERDTNEYLKGVVADKERQRDALEKQVADLKSSHHATPTATGLNPNSHNNQTTPLQQPTQAPRGAGGRGLSSIPSVSEDRPSVELSPSPPAIDRTSNKAPRPYSLLGDKTPDEDGFRSPSQDGYLTPESGLASVGPLNAAAARKPPQVPAATAANDNEELRRLRADNAKLKMDNSALNRKLRDHDALVEDHDALDKYLHDFLKPLISRLKRARGELTLDVERLQKENETLKAGGTGSTLVPGQDTELQEDHEALQNYVQNRLKPLVAQQERERDEFAIDIRALKEENEELKKVGGPEQLQEEYDALNNYLHEFLKPYVADLKRKRAELLHDAEVRDKKIEELEQQLAAVGGDGAPTTAARSAPSASTGDELTEDYEALDNYLHAFVKPAMASLKRARGELMIDKDRLTKQVDELKEENESLKRQQDPETANLQEEYDALNTFVQNYLKPVIGRLKRACAERTLDVERLQKEIDELKGGEASGAADRALPVRREGSGDAPQDLEQLAEDYEALDNYLHAFIKPTMADLKRSRAELMIENDKLKNENEELKKVGGPEQLQEEYDALNNYLHEFLKPYVADLKRKRAELLHDAEVRDKKIEELEQQLAAVGGSSVRASQDRVARSPGALSLSEPRDDVESLTRSQGVDDPAALRRELRKSQADAAAKGTALRKVQHELDVLKRAMESEGGAAAQPPQPREPSVEALTTSRSGPIDAALERELAAKTAEADQLRRDHRDLASRIEKELEPQVEELKEALADRDVQLNMYQQELAAVRESLEAAADDAEESRIRALKLGEAVEALRAELDDERQRKAAGDSAQSTGTRGAAKASPSQEPSTVGRATQPAYVGDADSVEAQNLVLSVRLADAETVISELQAALEKTAAQLDGQRRETSRLMNLVADLENEGNSRLA